ncbi:uncharacterized protein [Drosophila tropicalis]|uniref:uncharacterized protein n=1 Tax=Drosophila tropicalis TaxID=46794 RepID=UPI0035ABAF4E
MLDTRSQDQCCGNNVLSRFIFVTTNCSQYWDDFDTCRYECLYNHWNLLDSNNKIKRPQLYAMITQLYNPLNGYNNYGTAMKRAFEDCDKLYLKYADFILIYSTQAQDHLHLDKNCCSFECVFNSTQSLNGTSLVLPKVEQLLHIALNGDQKVIDIYMNGFRECSLQEAEMLRSLKRRRMEVVDNCSPMAVTYAICAHRYVNINCPEGSWTNSQQCNEAKDYSINCDMPKGRKAT